MKIFDSHIHLFSEAVIANVARRGALVQRLHLQCEGAEKRTSITVLKEALLAAGVERALLLPTASAGRVEDVNRATVRTATEHAWLLAAGTLHPEAPNIEQELCYLQKHHIRIIKLCSFSQRFSLMAPATMEMFNLIQEKGRQRDAPFTVVLDTLQQADKYFGTLPEHNTTPHLLAAVADRYPEINFIGAHMGGLGGDFMDLCRNLAPRTNLFLDTSNAAHTLTEKEFCQLLELHGPGHILFGTDWPWFDHRGEVEIIGRLLDLAGFDDTDQQRIFAGNLSELIGDNPKETGGCCQGRRDISCADIA